MSISIIIPVYNGGKAFQTCLESIVGCREHFHELIVVADGDTDGSRQLAASYGAKVIPFEQASGPAYARNQGAKEATGDILFFVDADVSIHTNTLQEVQLSLEDKSIVAVIGSYDDEPSAPQFLAQYKNLLHHYVHQTAKPDAFTFWGACGAIRRDVFLAMGGFDAERYNRPCIEDIELGYRLKTAGYNILLNKHLLIKHHKRWTVKSLLKTDFYDRALPWTTLIYEYQHLENDLNTDRSGRLSVALVGLMLLTCIGSIFLPALFSISWLSAVLLFVLNWPTYRFIVQKRGVWFAIRAIPWHWFYYFYSGLGFFVGTLNYRWNHFHQKILSSLSRSN